MRVFVPRNVARWVHCHRCSLPTLSWRNFRENHRELLCVFFGGPFESLLFFEPSIDLLIFMMVAKLVIHDGFSNVKSWLCMLQRTIWQTTQTPKKVPVPDVQPIQWLQRHHWFLWQPRILHSHARFTSKNLAKSPNWTHGLGHGSHLCISFPLIRKITTLGVSQHGLWEKRCLDYVLGFLVYRL